MNQLEAHKYFGLPNYPDTSRPIIYYLWWSESCAKYFPNFYNNGIYYTTLEGKEVRAIGHSLYFALNDIEWQDKVMVGTLNTHPHHAKTAKTISYGLQTPRKPKNIRLRT